MRSKYLLLISVVSILWACNSPKEFTIDERIASLENQLDSINNFSNPVRGEQMADSLLNLSPGNPIAISTKAYANLNNDKYQEALEYFKVLILSEKSTPFSLVALGICFERTDQIDSSLHYYRVALSKIDSSWQSPLREPHLLTVLEGKEAGLLALKKIREELNPTYYFKQKNSISRYNGGGLTTIDPFCNREFTEEEFYVTIPDSLYDNGIINSSSSVELAFAQMGVNVSCSGTDHRNKGFRLKVTSYFSNDLNNLDTLSIKKL